jgi:hypothetical protein
MSVCTFPPGVCDCVCGPGGCAAFEPRQRQTLGIDRCCFCRGALLLFLACAPPCAGRVLINAPLYKGLKPSTTTKSPANLIMFLISSVDGVEDRCMHVFK